MKVDAKYEALFTPWKIGNVEIKNRIVMCPMGGTSLFGWMGPQVFNKEAAAMFLDIAKNGCGLIIPGIAPLRNMLGNKWLYKVNGAFKDLKVWMEEFHKTGAKLFVQLTAGFGRAFSIPDHMKGIAKNKFLAKIVKPIFDFDRLLMAPSALPARWYPAHTVREITVEEILSPLKDTPAIPYLYARSLSSSLYLQNDTTYFESQKENFDRYIQSPYLRNSVLQIYQSKKGFQENPKPVSDYILYGRYQDQVNAQRLIPYMKPFYELLEKHRGKMIYLDFWTPWCPPCLAEMEPLKELRKKYNPEDITFISVCRTNNRERFEKVLDKYEMHVPGIEHIMTDDMQDDINVHKMYNQLNVHSFPHFFIINREGVIVNYGSMMRPSYPGTAACIEQWLGK